MLSEEDKELIKQYNKKEIPWEDLVVESDLDMFDLMKLMKKGIIKHWKTERELEDEREELRKKKLEARLSPAELELRERLEKFSFDISIHNLCFIDPETGNQHLGWDLDKLDEKGAKFKEPLGLIKKVLTDEEFKRIKPWLKK